MNKRRFFDIAANLTSDQFKGVYQDIQIHQNDLKEVINRGINNGVTKYLIAGSQFKDVDQAYQLIQTFPDVQIYMTIGVHPNWSYEVSNSTDYFNQLENYIQQYRKHIVAIGECGLDYFFDWSTPQQQKTVFPYHFDLAQKYDLPMYLHNRDSTDDFAKIVKENRHKFKKGICHCFTGSEEELKKILELDLFISINFLSFKTEENIKVLKQIPLEKLMIETDSPYCGLTNNNYAYKYVKTFFDSVKIPKKFELGKAVKGRNEPQTMVQVLECLAGVLNIDIVDLSTQMYSNSCKFFNVPE